MAKKIIIGNASVTGFVNFAEGNRIVIGTGSYTPKGGEKVYKESVTVFADQAFDGELPAKGKYVSVSGDLTVSERKDVPGELQSAMNIRFANQIKELEAPVKKSAGATTEEESI